MQYQLHTIHLNVKGVLGRGATTVTRLTVTLLPDSSTSACFTKKSKKASFFFDSLFPLTAVIEDPHPYVIPYFTDTGCMHALPNKETMAYFCA